MEIKGRVVASLGVQSGTSKAGNAWSKATIVIETEGQYPKKVALDNMKNAGAFASIPIGAAGTFSIDIESREFNGRWFTSVNCYKWDVTDYTQSTPAQQPVQQQPQSATPTLDAMGVKGYQGVHQAMQPQQTVAATDDLPF